MAGAQVWYICNVMQPPVLTSRDDFKGSTVLIYFAAAIPFFIAVWLLVKIANDPYWDIWFLILTVVCMLFAAYLIYYPTRFYSLAVYDYKLIATPMFGLPARQILYKDVTRWRETVRISKHNKEIYELTLYTSNGNLKFSSDWYNNYSKIKKHITHNLPPGSGQEVNFSGSTAECVVFVTLGLLLLTASYFYSDDIVLPAPLATVTGTLISEPVTIKPRKGSWYIDIELAEYPGFTFHITGQAYKAMDVHTFVSKAEKGKPFTMEILPNDYDVKLAHLSEPTFMEKHSGYHGIQVYGCRDGIFRYLTSEQYLMANDDKDHFTTILFFVIGFTLVITGTYKYVNRDW